MTDTDQTNSQTNEADDGWILGTDPLLRSWVGKWVDTRLPGASSTFEPAEVDASLPTIQLDGSDPVRMFNGEPVIGGCLEVDQ